MIVSELNEALLYQVETTQEELDRENVKLAMRLRTLFDERIPLTQLQRQKLFSINFRPDFGPPFLQLTEPQ